MFFLLETRATERQLTELGSKIEAKFCTFHPRKIQGRDGRNVRVIFPARPISDILLWYGGLFAVWEIRDLVKK